MGKLSSGKWEPSNPIGIFHWYCQVWLIALPGQIIEGLVVCWCLLNRWKSCWVGIWSQGAMTKKMLSSSSKTSSRDRFVPRFLCHKRFGSFFGDFEWESKLKQLGFQEMFGSWQSFDLILKKSQNWVKICSFPVKIFPQTNHTNPWIFAFHEAIMIQLLQAT